MKRWIWVVTIGAIVLAITALAIGRGLWRDYLEAPLSLGEEPVVFSIKPGTPLAAIVVDLSSRGWLTHPDWFVLYARMRGEAGSVRAGEYQFGPGTTPMTLLEQLVAGEVVQHAFTLVEGWNFREVRVQLAATEALRHTIDDADGQEVMRRLGYPQQHPEGRFLPETYYFIRGTSDLDILKRAHRLMQEHLVEAWAQRSPDLALDEPEQALVLASIVEKESRLDSERERIAGVFMRRLALGMRLQSDPTVIYGLGESYDGDIRRRDLKSDTPYNTYTRAGLPPTPIAMPGRASLRAAVNPADGNALYFVATGDPDGSHHFSETLAEHNRAVQRYLARLRSKP